MSLTYSLRAAGESESEELVELLLAAADIQRLRDDGSLTAERLGDFTALTSAVIESCSG